MCFIRQWKPKFDVSKINFVWLYYGVRGQISRKEQCLIDQQSLLIYLMFIVKKKLDTLTFTWKSVGKKQNKVIYGTLLYTAL